MKEKGFLSAHFILPEFTESPTARKHCIDNTPPPEGVENLKCLCHGTMEPLRKLIGLPIIITSGFRSKALNAILAHHAYAANRSQHLEGRACDFYIGWSTSPNGRGLSGSECPSHRERLIKAFRLILTSSSIDYDQLILYPNFIHVSYVSSERNRHCILIGNGRGQYCRVTLDTALTLE